MPDPDKLFGVLVTYRKDPDLARSLGRLRAQTRQLDRLLVIDNGSSPATRATVDRFVADGLAAEYIDAGDNLGPAGGFALGMELLLDAAGGDDWIFLFDDDDPPFFDDAVESAASFATEMVQRDPRTGAVGISGGRCDLGRGRVIRVGDEEIEGPVPVDHITAGGLPAYRVDAIRTAGVFDKRLFFGFEELEYGLRLGRTHNLYADGDRWRARKAIKREAALLPSEEESVARAATTSIRITSTSWRRFYSLRNLVYILRVNGHPWAAAGVGLSRGLAKPIVNVVFSPHTAWNELGVGWRALGDGWSGRLGRSVDPPDPATS